MASAIRYRFKFSVFAVLCLFLVLLPGAKQGDCCLLSDACESSSPCVSLFCDNSRCEYSPQQPGDCCVDDNECIDADPCTIGSCVDNSCQISIIPDCCTTYGAAQCEDADPCTHDFCCAFVDNGCEDGPLEGTFTCVHEPVPSCCASDADCTECSNRPKCVDGRCRQAWFTDGLPCVVPEDCSAGEAGDSYKSACFQYHACIDGVCVTQLQVEDCCSSYEDCRPPCSDADCTELEVFDWPDCVHGLCPTGKACGGTSTTAWCDFDWQCEPEAGATVVRCEYPPQPCTPKMCISGFSAEDACSTDNPFHECLKVDEYSDQCSDFHASECDDGNPCTRDQCVRASTAFEVIYDDPLKPFLADTPLAVCLHEDYSDCCLTDSDCATPSDCLVGECDTEHKCNFLSLDSCCTTDTNCDDGNQCSIDTCQDGRCVHAAVAGCCTEHADCGDSDDCTADYCEPYLTKCVHFERCCSVDDECPPGYECTNGTCVPPGDTSRSYDACSTDLDCQFGNPDPCQVGFCDEEIDRCLYLYQENCCHSNLRLVIVEGNLVQELAPELELLKHDYVAEGACVVVKAATPAISAFNLKKKLQYYYENYGLEGVFFVGDTPLAPSEIEYGSGVALNTSVDAYFSDLDDVFPDVSYDGLVDGYLIHSDDVEYGKGPEIVVGRILVPQALSGQGEATKLKSYLRKLHTYRLGGKRGENGIGRGAFGTSFEWEYVEPKVASLGVLFPYPQSLQSEMECTGLVEDSSILFFQAWEGTTQRMLDTIRTNFQWIVLSNHGGWEAIATYDGHLSAYDLNESWQIGSDFLTLDNCSGGRVATCDYGQVCTKVSDSIMLRYLTASITRGLAGVAVSVPGVADCASGVFYASLASGDSIGVALKKKFNAIASIDSVCPEFESSADYSLRVIGDPFLRLYVDWL